MVGNLEFLNIGSAKTLVYKGHSAPSGFAKIPITTPVLLKIDGFVGDEQADLQNHGGPDKAVCVYSLEHYPYWFRILGDSLPQSAAFGENFTTRGLTEDRVCIGDTFSVGECLLQITQPRQPCWKIEARYHSPGLSKQVIATGYTGFYFRVLQPGMVTSGDTVSLIEKDSSAITVAEANRIIYQKRDSTEALQRLLEVDALSASWREALEERLSGNYS